MSDYRSQVKLCCDCRFSMAEKGSWWILRCMHEKVVERDPVALADASPRGSNAREERSADWKANGRSPCGMRGELFSRKDDSA